MKHYFPIVNFGKKNIIVDFDFSNKHCLNDPYVRIGLVDSLPKNDEEYAQFVASNDVIGKASEVFPGCKGPKYLTGDMILDAFSEHCAEKVLTIVSEYLPFEVDLALRKVVGGLV